MESAAPRAIRVFISSTFSDMKGERDELVKRVFPRLRALCERRHVAWAEVDLRWGISDEEVAEGKVLPICLREVEQCRPYFIGLLGERYGRRPDRIPPSLIEQEPWLGEHRDKSVTELEIVKGVLADPSIAQQAFFYFRDPTFADRLPVAIQADYREADPDRRAQLARLKARIRASGVSVREGYPDPRALGELVFADLEAVIERRFPESATPDRWAREREAQAFFAESHRETYVPIEARFGELDAHVDGPNRGLVLLGSSGSGKTALLANWIPRQRDRHPDWFLLAHFTEATSDAAEISFTIDRLITEIATHFGLPANRLVHRSSLAETLEAASRKGRLVVIVDGVDAMREMAGGTSFDWLPRELPENVRLIISTGPHAGLGDLPFLAPHWQPLGLAPFTESDRRALIARYLAKFTKSLPKELIDRIPEPFGAAPLYLRLLLDELRVEGDHDSLARELERYSRANSPLSLYHLILSRWERDYDGGGARAGLVRDAMRLLWASRAGLTESELLDLLGTIATSTNPTATPLPQAQWAPFRFGAGSSLVSRAGRITLSNRALKTAVKKRFVPDERTERRIRARLILYFSRRRTTDRVRDEFPYQAALAGEWPLLGRLLGYPRYLLWAWRVREAEVRYWWGQLETHSSLRMPDVMRSVIDADLPDLAVGMIAARLLCDFHYPKEAEQLARRVMERARREKPVALPNALLVLAAARRADGNAAGALRAYLEVQTLARRRRRRDYQELARQGEGLALLDLGDLDRAEAMFRKSERSAARAGRIRTVAAAVEGLALVCERRGDPAGTLALAERAEGLFRAVNDQSGLARVLMQQATISHGQGNLVDAWDGYRRAVDLFRQVGDRPELARALERQTELAQAEGNALEEIEALESLAAVERSLGDRRSSLVSLARRARLMLVQKEFDDLVPAATELIALATEQADLDTLEESHWLESVAQRELGRAEEATRALARHAALCRQLGRPPRSG